jgi:hypothetical protein
MLVLYRSHSVILNLFRNSMRTQRGYRNSEANVE